MGLEKGVVVEVGSQCCLSPRGPLEYSIDRDLSKECISMSQYPTHTKGAASQSLLEPLTQHEMAEGKLHTRDLVCQGRRSPLVLFLNMKNSRVLIHSGPKPPAGE